VPGASGADVTGADPTAADVPAAGRPWPDDGLEAWLQGADNASRSFPDAMDVADERQAAAISDQDLDRVLAQSLGAAERALNARALVDEAIARRLGGGAGRRPGTGR
jgi:hypothetical protein